MRWTLGGEEEELVSLMLQECWEVYTEGRGAGNGRRAEREGGKEREGVIQMRGGEG
jgi:hypothetical protein